MPSILLLIAAFAGDVAASAALKDLPADSLGYVAVTAEATRTNAHGLQIVSIRIRSTRVDPRQDVGWNVKLSALKLVVATRDPKTKINVIYPSGREKGDGSVYCKEEVAIQVIVQRAAGDQSPVQGRLDFSISRVFT